MKLRRDILTRKLTKAFAENGSKVEIPLDIQPSGSVSFNEGFGGLYSKPVKPQSEGEQAGLQIQRENINWLFNAITSDIIQNSDDLGALEDEVAGLITSFTKTPKLLTENLTWNIGSGGDYEDLQTAINEASKYVTKNRVFITLNLLQNFSINKTIIIGENIQKNIIITQQDYNTPILTSEDINNVFNILGSIYFKGCYFKENGNSKKTTLFNVNSGRYEDFTYATPTKCENYNNAFKLQFASLNNIYAAQQINCNNGISSSSGSISYISSNSNMTANIAFNALTQNGIIFK